MLFSHARRFSVFTPRTSFAVTTWLPSLKEKNENGALVRTPMTSIEAKRLKVNNPKARVDLYGHACAKVIIDLKDPTISQELINAIKMIADQRGHDARKINLVQSYISWYPTDIIGRDKTVAEVGKLMDHDAKLEKEDGELSDLKRNILKLFLGNIYKAENGDPDSDKHGYGISDPSRVIEFKEIDFFSIFITCADMMECDLENDVLVMNRIRPEGMYSGLDMFETCKKLIGFKDDKESLIPKSEHVCTTAVLRLLEAGVGKKVFFQAMKDVIAENPEFSHGFPISEFTHAICKKLYLVMQAKQNSDSAIRGETQPRTRSP